VFKLEIMTSEYGSSVGTDDHCIILSTRANQAKEIHMDSNCQTFTSKCGWEATNLFFHNS